MPTNRATPANKEILADTQRKTGESPRLIREITSFTSSYIAAIIKEGAFEAVLLPYFGKFQAKTKEVQWRAQRRGEK